LYRLAACECGNLSFNKWQLEIWVYCGALDEGELVVLVHFNKTELECWFTSKHYVKTELYTRPGVNGERITVRPKLRQCDESNFMKIPTVGAEIFHAEFRDKRTDMMMLTVAFHSFVNIPKTRTARHRARGWLRNCTANRNVVDLIPDVVTGIFHWLNPPGLTMPLGSTRSLTGISTMCTVTIGVILLVYFYTRHMQKK